MNELALFAGAGGGILGGELLGWSTVCAVEINAFCRKVLLARQRDGILPRFPIWDDVQSFDGKPWKGYVDIISGGFPCQDISCSGKGAGISGQRSGLWGEMSRIIGEVRPPFVFVENVPMLVTRGLGLVLTNLAQMGYNARWGIMGAAEAGLPHKRARIWLVAYSNTSIRGTNGTYEKRCNFRESTNNINTLSSLLSGMDYRNSWKLFSESMFCRKDNGLANWMDRHTAIGNGQVSAVVVMAWEVLSRSNEKLNEVEKKIRKFRLQERSKKEKFKIKF